MKTALLRYWTREAIWRIRPACAELPVRRVMFYRWLKRWVAAGSPSDKVLRVLGLGFGACVIIAPPVLSKDMRTVMMSTISGCGIAALLWYDWRAEWSRSLSMRRHVRHFVRQYRLDGMLARCSKCDYSLDGLHERGVTRCPECGARIS